MNSTDSNTLDAGTATHTFCVTNQVIVDTVLKFKSGVTTLGGILDSIDATVGPQKSKITGPSKDKKAARVTLIDAVLAVSGPAESYANEIGDNTLRDKVHFTKTSLGKLNDDEIADVANDLFDLLDPLQVTIQPYGLTVIKLTDMQSAAAAFAGEKPKPRLAITNKTVLTKKQKTLIRKLRKHMSEILDPLIINFKTTEPDFFDGYNEARKTVDLGKGTTRVKGDITEKDADPVIVIPGAILKITNGTDSYIIKPDINGNFEQKIKRGTYTGLCIAPNYDNLIIAQFLVKQGSTVVLHIKMTKTI